jgi:hypothetical protein
MEMISMTDSVVFTSHDVVESLFANPQGFSINSEGGIPFTGYMVALADAELILDGFQWDKVLAWVEEHWTAVSGDEWGDTYFGIWEDDTGKAYLNVFERWTDREYATAVGLANSQTVIWDLDRGEEIHLA